MILIVGCVMSTVRQALNHLFIQLGWQTPALSYP